jgi:hypothetical protein
MVCLDNLFWYVDESLPTKINIKTQALAWGFYDLAMIANTLGRFCIIYTDG